MTTKLIIINGAPGSGKSTVGKLLHRKLENSAFLDGDEVWRINPFEVNERTKTVVIENISSVLRHYIKAEYEYVILTWVLHDQTIIDQLLDKLGNLPKTIHIFTLVASEPVLLERLRNDPGKKRDVDLAILRLKQTNMLKTQKIDNTFLDPEEVVSNILCMLKRT